MYLKAFKQEREADGEATSLSRAFIGVEEVAADGALRLFSGRDSRRARQIHMTHGGVFTHSGERKPNDANYIWMQTHLSELGAARDDENEACNDETVCFISSGSSVLRKHIRTWLTGIADLDLCELVLLCAVEKACQGGGQDLSQPQDMVETGFSRTHTTLDFR